MDNLDEEIKKEKSSRYSFVFYIILLVSILFVIFFYLFKAPVQKGDTIIHIGTNDSLSKVSNELKEKNVICYPFLFKSFISIFGGDKNIKNGDYLFKKDESLLGVSMQIIRGRHDIAPIKITFKEGITNEEMASLLADKLSTFRKDLFLSDRRSKQGYLFPDTYFFFPLSTTDEILNEMTLNFKKRIASKEEEIKLSGKSLEDIITMASILEKEANGKEDSFIISGILWKRITLGMPLQVDAAPETYKESILPKSPICNPGASSINAAIHPQESPYLFYLHDDNGIVHYAIDFSQHRSNIARYLK